MSGEKSKIDERTAVHINTAVLTVWYQALLNRFNNINNANTSADNKTSIILATSVAVLIFGAERMVTKPNFIQLAGIVMIVTCIILCLVNINLRATPSEVNSTEDRPDYYHKHDDDFVWQMIADLEMSITTNSGVNLRKAKLYTWITSLFVAGSLLLFAGSYVDISIRINS